MFSKNCFRSILCKEIGIMQVVDFGIPINLFLIANENWFYFPGRVFMEMEKIFFYCYIDIDCRIVILFLLPFFVLSSKWWVILIHIFFKYYFYFFGPNFRVVYLELLKLLRNKSRNANDNLCGLEKSCFKLSCPLNCLLNLYMFRITDKLIKT